MRLIDADKFKNRIKVAAFLNGTVEAKEKVNLFIKLLDGEETAYDVDKVVEQIASEYTNNVDGDTGEHCNNWVVDMQNGIIENHIEIIKSGGR